MFYPTGILVNKATGRFHPISFRMAPMPGNSDANTTAQRYKSAGHHTDGFDTKAEAQTWIAQQQDKGVINVGKEYDWDGKEMPAMVDWFTKQQLVVAETA